MVESRGVRDVKTLVLRISIPAGDGYHAIVKELAARVAAYAGESEARSRGAVADVEDVSSRVASAGSGREGGEETVFEFRRTGDALVIHATCAGRSADTRHPLPT
jgi:hypothetical protein